MPAQVARFFLVSPLVPRALILAFAAAALGGGVVIAMDVRCATRTLAPVLLLQVFAASSGFIVPARRGHYDLLLTSGARRTTVALMHCLMSALPGLMAWVILAAIERAAGGGTLTGPGTVGVLFFLSTVPWALNVPLARLSAAIVCLLTGLAMVVISPDDGPGAGTLVRWASSVLAMEPRRAFALMVAGGCAVVAAVAWIQRTDLPLESGQ